MCNLAQPQNTRQLKGCATVSYLFANYIHFIRRCLSFLIYRFVIYLHEWQRTGVAVVLTIVAAFELPGSACFTTHILEYFLFHGFPPACRTCLHYSIFYEIYRLSIILTALPS